MYLKDALLRFARCEGIEMESLYDAVKKGGDLSSYGKAVNILTKQKKSLYTAFFQLTPFCNLKCRMCYARLSPKDVLHSGGSILRFEQWKWYIDEAMKEGLTELAFTGGECTLHPDFCEIYAYAYDQGLQIIVMTNGSYVTEQILSLWKERPPLSISITIYGSSMDTYRHLCGNRPAHAKVYQNIRMLDEAGFFLNLKYTAVRENIHELLSVDRFCRQEGYNLYATHILTQFDRCTSDVLEKEKADEEEFKSIMEQIRYERSNVTSGNDEKSREDLPESSCDLEAVKKSPKRGIVCSAARNSCYIDWEGMITPCVAFDALRLNPAKKGFRECWREMTEWAGQIPVLEECVSCIHKYKCNRCIALHFNDTRSFNKVSPRLCWKRKYPQQAKDIERQLIEKGLIHSEEMDDFKG